MTIRERTNSDSISGGVVLLVILVFWLERDFTNPLASSLPDTVLFLLTVLALLLVIRGVLRPQDATSFESIKPLGLLAAGVLLTVWVLLVYLLGYIYSGIAMFLVVALFLRERPLRFKEVLMDATVSILVVGGVYLIFARLLLVPLPTNLF